MCVESGKETRVRANLRREAAVADIPSSVFHSVLVPAVRELTPTEYGRLIMKSHVKYEGYLFVNMLWCEQTADLVAKTKYAFGLLPHRPAKPKMPPNKQPSPAQQAEWDRWVNWCPTGLETAESAALLLDQQAQDKKKVPSLPTLRAGEIVEVIDRTSPFAKMRGPVSVGDDDTFTVTLTVLGHPVERDFQRHQIKPVG